MRKTRLLLLACAVTIMFTACSSSNTMELSQKANHSSGSYWKYELSNNDVIKEIDYEETSFFGPGYTQHWTFEIIGEGEVIIQWLAYEGDVYQEKDSYSVTYTFDGDGNREIILTE